jgi:putative transposase
VYSCKYHVVWCPKYRRPVLAKPVDSRLKRILVGVARDFRAEIIEMEVMPDHVHLLLEVDPQFGIHRLVRHMKGRSSRLLRQEFGWLTTRLPTLWTNSYFVSTVGGAPWSAVKQYIENQKRSEPR